MTCPHCSGALLNTYRRTEEERGVFLSCRRCGATYDRPDESSPAASARGGVRPSHDQPWEGSVGDYHGFSREGRSGLSATADGTPRPKDTARRGFDSPPSHFQLNTGRGRVGGRPAGITVTGEALRGLSSVTQSSDLPGHSRRSSE